MVWVSFLLGCVIILIFLFRHTGKSLNDAVHDEVEATREGFIFFGSAVQGIVILMAVVLVVMVIYVSGLLLWMLL